MQYRGSNDVKHVQNAARMKRLGHVLVKCTPKGSDKLSISYGQEEPGTGHGVYIRTTLGNGQMAVQNRFDFTYV